MRRLVILICLLLVFGAFYFFSQKDGDEKINALNAERSFMVEATALHKVIISERNKKPVLLTRNTDKTWQLNNKYLARENAVDNLLEILENVELKYIPESQAKKNILNEMRTIGIQVDLYDKEDNRIKSYQVGGSTPDERGTYLMMSGSRQPFVVKIPSMEGSIRGRFILSESDWRDRSVVKEDVSKLAYINVQYFNQRENDFQLSKNNSNQWTLRNNEQQELNANPENIRAYVEGFDQVYAEYIDNKNPLRDSISNLIPFTQIDYGETAENHKTLRLFSLNSLLLEEDEDMLTDGDKVKIDGRYFVDCSWGDFMLVQHRLIGKLLRGKSFFETK